MSKSDMLISPCDVIDWLLRLGDDVLLKKDGVGVLVSQNEARTDSRWFCSTCIFSGLSGQTFF